MNVLHPTLRSPTDRPSAEGAGDGLIGVSVGGYRIERLLGEGGMGLVYQARHEVIDRRFAIKVLRPEVASDQVLAKNFLAEAQTLSALKHPNIVDIVGFGLLPDGRQYMVMECLEGVTLEDELSQGRLSLERVHYVADQVLVALHAAHSVEVIHRDLKPSNIFLARGSGGVQVVKLLDFGLARRQPVNLGAIGGVADAGYSLVAGTPEYIAPEQAFGGKPDKSSDLYSFGVLLFEMLTGRLPFIPDPSEGNRAVALIRAHADQLAPSPEQIGVQVSPPLTALLRELLEKSPQARPVSAAALRLRLQLLQSLRPSANPLEEISAPARPIVTRARWQIVAVASVALAVLLMVLLGSSFGSAAPVQLVEKPVQVPVQVVSTVVEPEVIQPMTPVKPPVAAVRPRRTDCSPDARWRAAAMVNLQELQQLASASGTHWADFERLEPVLSNQIDSASNGEQCEAAERRIRKLAAAWRK